MRPALPCRSHLFLFVGCVMNNPNAKGGQTPTEIRLQLLCNGYPSLPLNGKAPLQTEWTTKPPADAEEIRKWPKRWPNATNTGVPTKLTPFLDIDIKVPDAAQAVEDLVRSRFEDDAAIAVRFGNTPKRADTVSTDTPFAKVAVNLVAPDGTKGQKLEFLGNGQQCVVDGVHPDTKQPYRWFGKSLAEIPYDQLPYISVYQARQLVDDAVDLLVSEHGYTVSGQQNKTNVGAGHSEAYGELVRQVATGENYHEALTSLAWRQIAAGVRRRPGSRVSARNYSVTPRINER